MCSITIWKKLFINTVTTDTVYLFCRVFFDFFQKFFYELNKQGVNLNQLAAAANTLILLQDMPDMGRERRRELAAQIENFVAMKAPYCKALAETRGLMMQLRRQSEVER